MRYAKIKKSDLEQFINFAKETWKIVAPIAKENKYVFSEIESYDEIKLDYNITILPPTKYFFPQKEKLLDFDMKENKSSESNIEMDPTIIFGVHPCDIEAISCLKAVFYREPYDVYFHKREKEILVIGLECVSSCHEYATCKDMNTNVSRAGYDMLLIPNNDDEYIVHINSKVAYMLAKSSNLFEDGGGSVQKELNSIRENKKDKYKSHLKKEYQHYFDVFEMGYNAKVWEDIGEKCLSCGNCTTVCPTCYCFDVIDNVDLSIESGDRTRVWDSCQLEEFARVAGNHNFRGERSSRQRHRFYRKFNYSIKKYNKYFCVGCGRCTLTCMADISLIDTVNQLIEEVDNNE